MRSVALGGSAPPLSRSVGPAFTPVDEQTRHVGHAAVDFIVQEFGKAGVRRLLLALRNPQPADGIYQRAFGITPAQFEAKFARYVETRFRG